MFLKWTMLSWQYLFLCYEKWKKSPLKKERRLLFLKFYHKKFEHERELTAKFFEREIELNGDSCANVYKPGFWAEFTFYFFYTD